MRALTSTVRRSGGRRASYEVLLAIATNERTEAGSMPFKHEIES